VFRKDSAGLGVPRGSLGKLNGFSNQATQHGMASTNIYYNGAQRGEAESAGHSAYSGSASSSRSVASPSYAGGAPGLSSGGSHAAGPAGGGASGGAGRH